MSGWLLAVGALAMLAQVALLRECEVAFYGSELVLVLALGAWMLGTAAGAASGRRAHVPGERAVRAVFVTLGVAAPLEVALARAVRVLFGGVPGAYLPFTGQLPAMALCVMPTAFLLGLLFQWVTKRYVADGGSAAFAYALESAGGVAGGLLATLLPALGVQNWCLVLLCAIGAFVAAWPGSRASRETAAAGVFLALLALATAPAMDRAMTALNHPDLLATRDTPYGRVTVSGALGQVAVFESDALAYESGGTAAEEFAHLAAVQRPAPRSVLVLGGATQGLVAEVLRHAPAHVDDVELDRALVALVMPHLPDSLRRALADPRVLVHYGDPRRFVERGGTWDLILVGMPEPESGRTNRYYTREFFAACAGHLTPDGVLALRLRGAENLWTPALARRAAGVRRALRASFADAVVLPGATNVFLASHTRLERDPAVLGRRLVERGIAARRVTPAYLRYLYANDRYLETARMLARTPAAANRDARPACYQDTMLLWLARFFPSLARLDLPDVGVRGVLRLPWTWLGVLVLGALLLLARPHPTLRRALFAGLAGFAGMLLEAALLLQYQTSRGVLYQDLGLLLMAFMAGLALGALAVGHLLRSRPAAEEPLERDEPPVPRGAGGADSAGVTTLLLLVVLGLGCAWLLRSDGVQGLAAAGGLLFACGALVAMAFAWAVGAGAPDAGPLVGPVYAGDVLGGCVASLAAGLVVIPMLGLPAAALLAAAAGVAAFLLL